MIELAGLERTGDARAAEDVDGVGWSEGILPVDEDAGEDEQGSGARQRQDQEEPAGPTTET